MPADPNLIQQFQEILGERVRAQRREARLTQLALAKQAEVSRATLANIEVGAQRASAFLLAQLAQTLGIPVEKLIPGLAEAQARLEESRKVPLDGDVVPELLKRHLEELDLSVEPANTLEDALKAVVVRQNRRKQTAR